MDDRGAQGVRHVGVGAAQRLVRAPVRARADDRGVTGGGLGLTAQRARGARRVRAGIDDREPSPRHGLARQPDVDDGAHRQRAGPDRVGRAVLDGQRPPRAGVGARARHAQRDRRRRGAGEGHPEHAAAVDGQRHDRQVRGPGGGQERADRRQRDRPHPAGRPTRQPARLGRYGRDRGVGAERGHRGQGSAGARQGCTAGQREAGRHTGGRGRGHGVVRSVRQGM